MPLPDGEFERQPLGARRDVTYRRQCRSVQSRCIERHARKLDSKSTVGSKNRRGADDGLDEQIKFANRIMRLRGLEIFCLLYVSSIPCLAREL
jgi:hypothetical protein